MSRKIRLRAGRSGDGPLPDPRNEDPWSDLWFYSDPIVVHVH